MKKTTLKFSLSDKSIDSAIKQIAEYKAELLRKTEVFQQKVAKRIAELAQSGFNNAIVDDRLRGGGRKADVDVSVKQDGKMSIVIADGEDAVWVEFGSGVYHNTPVGTSPNPLGIESGFTIGSYGKGFGKGRVWGYYDDGELVLTHGTPATMPMYNAVKTVCDEIQDIAKEVFG